MKLKNRLKILRNNVFIVIIGLAILLTCLLQFLDFVHTGKNRIGKFLESIIYNLAFKNHDLRKNISNGKLHRT